MRRGRGRKEGVQAKMIMHRSYRGDSLCISGAKGLLYGTDLISHIFFCAIIFTFILVLPRI